MSIVMYLLPAMMYWGASGMVSQLARDIGFATHNSGRLRKVRDLEAEMLSLFHGWGGPTLFTLVLFIIEVVYLVVMMYVIGWRHHISEFPTYMMYKAFSVMSMNLLALCYLPSVLAAFAQIFYGTKQKRFQPWLDAWPQAQKQLGIYGLLFGFMRMIKAMTCLNMAYFGYLFNQDRATIPFNTTKDTVIRLDSKMKVFGECCIITGVMALCAMGILGLTHFLQVVLCWNSGNGTLYSRSSVHQLPSCSVSQHAPRHDGMAGPRQLTPEKQLHGSAGPVADAVSRVGVPHPLRAQLRVEDSLQTW